MDVLHGLDRTVGLLRPTHPLELGNYQAFSQSQDREMRRSTFYWPLISLIVVAFASVAVAQQSDTAHRATGSPTLFDILQSRLKAGGLTAEPTTTQQQPSRQHQSAQRQQIAPKRVVPKDSRVLVETDIDVPGSAPLPANSDGALQSGGSATSRIHQRLSAFRDSQFGSPGSTANDTRLQASTAPAGDALRAPIEQSAGSPTLAPPEAAEEPRIVGDAMPGAEAPRPRLATPTPKYATEAAPQGTTTERAASPPVAEAAPRTAPARDRAAAASSQVLFTQQSPILNVKTLGPGRIDVGREATFQVSVENLGSAAANELIITIDLPQWADLLGAEVSTGATSSEVAPDGTRLFRWKIGQLGAKDVQTVALHLVARQSEPLNLTVNWQHAPVASAASISVLHPDLKLNLEGPEEVLFGKKQTYRLELENAGTGDARGVTIALLPVGTGQEKPAVQPLGDLAAGQKKSMEVELTARNEGDLVIQVDATAEGNIRAHLSEKVRVLRPALAVEVSAPEFQFVGQELTYRIVVTNPGTAKASEVQIQAALPDSVSHVSSTKEDMVDESGGQIRWAIQELKPQESRTLLVKCMAVAAGAGRIAVSSKALDNLNASGEATVQIDAIADLALEVTDPAGPVAVGTETVYQLKVENRGSKSADHVEIVAYFSHGIEPLSAEGGNYQVGPGQIVFDAIPSIAAGQAKTFVVKARAESTGNHIIRAEVFCKPLGTRLVGEESTYFFGKRVSEQMEKTVPQPRIAEEGVLTAEETLPPRRAASSRINKLARHLGRIDSTSGGVLAPPFVLPQPTPERVTLCLLPRS